MKIGRAEIDRIDQNFLQKFDKISSNLLSTYRCTFFLQLYRFAEMKTINLLLMLQLLKRCCFSCL